MSDKSSESANSLESKTSLNDRIRACLRRLGYRFADGRLIALGVQGLCSDRVLPYQFNTLFSAADYLVPITKDDVLRELVGGAK